MANQHRITSIILLLILGALLLRPLFGFSEHGVSDSDCLEFGHIHIVPNLDKTESTTEAHSDWCSGQMLNSAFLPVSYLDFTNLFLEIKIDYASFFNLDYTDPDSKSIRKPPRLS